MVPYPTLIQTNQRDDRELPVAIFGDLERLIDDIYPYRWLIVALAAIAISLLATTLYRRGSHRKLRRHKRRTALRHRPAADRRDPALVLPALATLDADDHLRGESARPASRNSVPGVPAATSPPTAPVASATTLTATPTTHPACQPRRPIHHTPSRLNRRPPPSRIRRGTDKEPRIEPTASRHGAVPNRPPSRSRRGSSAAARFAAPTTSLR